MAEAVEGCEACVGSRHSCWNCRLPAGGGGGGAQVSDSCLYTIKQTTAGQSGTAESTRTFVGLKDTRGWRDGPWVRALAALPEDQSSVSSHLYL